MLPRSLPAMFGPFELTRRLGQGGMAVVYEGYRLGAHGIHTRVAVKCIRLRDDADESLLRMFINEAAVTVNLNHPNLISVHEFNEEDGVYYLAMEYVDGYDLGVLISALRRRGQRLSPGIVAEILHQILSGLDHAHRARDSRGHALNLIHRDLKPGNIFITRGGMVKVADFGIAKATTSMIETEAGLSKGTPAYMSREQLDGQPLTPASDIFSLGLVLYEMLTGQRLLKETSIVSLVMALVRMDVDKVVADLPEEAAPFEGLIRKALAHDPKDRYQSARSMLKALRKVEDHYDGAQSLGDFLEALSLDPEMAKLASDYDLTALGAEARKTVASDATALPTALAKSPFADAILLQARGHEGPPFDDLDPIEVRSLFNETSQGAGLQEVYMPPPSASVVSLLHGAGPSQGTPPPITPPAPLPPELQPGDMDEPPESLLFLTPQVQIDEADTEAATPHEPRETRAIWLGPLLLTLALLGVWILWPSPDIPPPPLTPDAAPPKSPPQADAPPSQAPAEALPAAIEPPLQAPIQLTEEAKLALEGAEPDGDVEGADGPPALVYVEPSKVAKPATYDPRPGRLKLNIIPAHEHFEIDGGEPQSVPWSQELKAGVHRVNIRCEGQGEPYSKAVRVKLRPGREDLGVWDCTSKSWFKAPQGLLR